MAEHAPCMSVLFGSRSHADSQGLIISSGGVAANAKAAIRSSSRPGGARGILRGRARWRLGSRQLREPGASLRAAGVPPLAAPNAPGGRTPGPARPPECGPHTALAHAACSPPHITSLHYTLDYAPEKWAAILRRFVLVTVLPARARAVPAVSRSTLVLGVATPSQALALIFGSINRHYPIMFLMPPFTRFTRNFPQKYCPSTAQKKPCSSL